jgi:hypothetical protein
MIGERLGDCAICCLPVMYGDPAWWGLTECCGEDQYCHQSCLEVEMLRVQKEREEEGQVLRPALN